jgi:hypothetical protein
MKLKRNSSWIAFLLVVALQLMPLRLDAFVLTLGEGLPQDPGAQPSSGADVLYATNRDGQEVRVASTDTPLGDETPLDLGTPSVGPDGAVVFGAAFRRRDRVRWEIFAANPDTHSVSRLPLPLSRSEGALEFVNDPTPLAQSDGSVVFAAEDDSHAEAVYRLRGGKLTRLIRAGSSLGQGRVLRNIGFGSIATADSGAVALIGYVTPLAKAELLISDSGISVIAAVGQTAPDGVRYRDLGPPSISSPHGLTFAFPAFTDRGARVYESDAGKLRVALTTGTNCPSGKISYISQDRVGLNSDGSITVAARCSGSPAILLMKGSQRTMVIGRASVTSDSGFVDLYMPRLFDNGTIVFNSTTRHKSLPAQP